MNPTAVKGLFVGLGAVAVLIGLAWLGYSALLVARAQSADGVVVNQEVEDSSTASVDGTVYAPVVSFKTADGREVTFTSIEHAARSKYPLGLHLRVLYDPARPQRAEIDSWETLWLFGSAFVVGGLALVGAGFGAAWTMRQVRGPVGSSV
jgi:hypothetical protein